MQDSLILLILFILPAVPFISATLHHVTTSCRLTALQGFPILCKPPLNLLSNSSSSNTFQIPSLFAGRYQHIVLFCARSSLLVCKHYILYLFNILPNWKHTKEIKSSLDNVNVWVSKWMQRRLFFNPSVQNMLIVPSAADQWLHVFHAVEANAADS